MANIKSQKKRNRQNEKRRLRNKAVRTELKTRIKSARQAIDEGADATASVQAAQKRLAKAAAAGIVHKNQAARRTSRLMRRAGRSS
jgi:small subunit ribosomal protein S20